MIKSGYFFIENTIFNDLRFNNYDCSEYYKNLLFHSNNYVSTDMLVTFRPVIAWARENKIDLIDSKSMEDTRFIDLTIRLGFPYLFTHLGNCEHLIIFTSVKFEFQIAFFV